MPLLIRIAFLLLVLYIALCKLIFICQIGLILRFWIFFYITFDDQISSNCDFFPPMVKCIGGGGRQNIFFNVVLMKNLERNNGSNLSKYETIQTILALINLHFHAPPPFFFTVSWNLLSAEYSINIFLYLFCKIISRKSLLGYSLRIRT